jgi:hypothetical protein
MQGSYLRGIIQKLTGENRLFINDLEKYLEVRQPLARRMKKVLAIGKKALPACPELHAITPATIPLFWQELTMAGACVHCHTDVYQ